MYFNMVLRVYKCDAVVTECIQSGNQGKQVTKSNRII